MPRKNQPIRDLPFHEKVNPAQREKKFAYIANYMLENDGRYPPELPADVFAYAPRPVDPNEWIYHKKKVYLFDFGRMGEVERKVVNLERKMKAKIESMAGLPWEPKDEKELLETQDELFRWRDIRKEGYELLAKQKKDLETETKDRGVTPEGFMRWLHAQSEKGKKRSEELESYLADSRWVEQHPESAARYRKDLRYTLQKTDDVYAMIQYELSGSVWAGELLQDRT